MATLLFKTEPSTYSFRQLAAAKSARWDGVKNAAALQHLRAARKGDEVFIYHTGDEKAIVGLAEITRAAYEDPANPGLNAKGEPKSAVVDLKALRSAPTPVTLAALKADARFKDFVLIKQSRLSVMPVPLDLDKILRTLAGLAR